jgi:hypothetical protein
MKKLTSFGPSSRFLFLCISDNSFSTLLALFFPAVTDPLAGSNLSGDLKNAAKSIPPGTLAAVAFTSFIFLANVGYLSTPVPPRLLNEGGM